MGENNHLFPKWHYFCLLFTRNLDHPNIVKFYGTSLRREKDSVRMILVMEKCKGNLKSHIFKHPEFVPGKSEDSYVIREACRWVEEITDALAYIHEKGIVHRDLKLENILVCIIVFSTSLLPRASMYLCKDFFKIFLFT